MAADPDEIVDHVPAVCGGCGCDLLAAEPAGVVVRQVRHQQGSFSLGRVVASFALAPTDENSGAVSAILPKLAPTR